VPFPGVVSTFAWSNDCHSWLLALPRKATASRTSRLIALVDIILSLPCGEQRSRIRSVTYWQATLAILAALSVSMALAEDFKTTNGKEYKDATITRVEGDGIVIRTKTGISKVYFTELSKEVQERFHYGQATPIAAQREREPIKEAKQDGRRQPDKGHRVVVVGQSAVSLKVFVAGILVLVGVVLAIIRSRS
jgi:hypothetical protein